MTIPRDIRKLILSYCGNKTWSQTQLASGIFKSTPVEVEKRKIVLFFKKGNGNIMIKKFDLKNMKKQSKIAIFGGKGTGKTTLITDILHQKYGDVTEGAIMTDNPNEYTNCRNILPKIPINIPFDPNKKNVDHDNVIVVFDDIFPVPS